MSKRTVLITVLLLIVFSVNVLALGELSARYLKQGDKAMEKGDEYLKNGDKKKAFKEYEDAINYYDKVLNQDPTYIPAFVNIVQLYMAMEKLEEAEKYALRFKMTNKNSIVCSRIALIYHVQKKYDKAIAAYEETLSLPEDYGTPTVVPSVYNNLTALYDEMYQADKSKTQYLDKAIEYGLKALKLQVPGSEVRLAALYKEKGDLAAALDAVDKAITADPDNFELKILKAAILEDAGKQDEALKIYDTILNEKIDAFRLEQIAVRYYKAKQFTKAAEVYERVIASNPPQEVLVGIYLDTANCYQQLEKEARTKGDNSAAEQYASTAKKYFDKVSSTAPENPTALIQQADDALEKKDYDTAISMYEKLVNMGKADSSIYINLGSAYFNKKDYSNAEINFQKAADSNTDDRYNFNIYYNLGYTQYVLGMVKIQSGSSEEGKSKLTSAKKNLNTAKNYTTEATIIQSIEEYVKQIDMLLK